MLWAFEGTCLLFSCPFLCQAVLLLWARPLCGPTASSLPPFTTACSSSTCALEAVWWLHLDHVWYWLVLFLQGHLYSNRAKYLQIFLYKKENSGKSPGVHWGVLIEWGSYCILQITWCEAFNPSQTCLSLTYSTQMFYRIAWEIANENSNLCFLNFGVMDLFKTFLSAVDPISS